MPHRKLLTAVILLLFPSCAGSQAQQTDVQAPGAVEPGTVEIDGQPPRGTTGATSAQSPAVRRRTATAEERLQEPPPGSIGTAGAAMLLSASPNMSWVALCQARRDTDGNGRVQARVAPQGELEGDLMEPYLVEGSGKGRRIDEFVGNSPGGRFVAFIQDQRLLLKDTKTGVQTDLSALGADPRNDGSSFEPHRAASFDPLGRYVTYIRRQGPRTWVILRDLHNGEETPIDPGPGLLWRAQFEPAGEYIKLSVVSKDTNGDRRLSWPAPPTSIGHSACPSPLPHYSIRETVGDEVDVSLYHLETGKLISVPNFVGTAGAEYIIRKENGELWQATPGAPRVMIGSEQCLGKVLHVDDQSGNVLFGCAPSYGARRELYIRSVERRKGLDMDLAAFENDGRYPHQPRFLIVNPHSESFLIDIRTGRVLPLKPRTFMLASYEDNVLAHRKDWLRWIDSEAHETALDIKRQTLGHQLQRGRYFALGSALFDLKTSKYLGTFRHAPLSISRAGQGLVPSARKGLFPIGPLKWSKARRSKPKTK